MKSIALGKTHYQLRSYSTGCFATGICLDIEIVWLVEYQVDIGIQGITIYYIAQTVEGLHRTGGKLDAGIAEESHLLESGLGTFLGTNPIQFAGTQAQALQNDTRTYRHLSSVIMETQIAAYKGILQLLHILLSEINMNLSDIPLSGSLIIHAVCHHQPQLYLAGHIHGIGKIRSITVLIEIIAPVAEETGDTLTFRFHVGDIERTPLPDERLVHGGIYELPALGREVEISHRIECPKMAEVYMIGNLRLLRIALCQHIISHLTIKIAIFIELMLSYLCTELRVHICHQLRLGTEHLGYPLGYCSMRLGESIPYPQAHRERCTVIAASEQSTVRSRSQGILHLGDGRIGIGSLLVVLILDRYQPRKQLLVFFQRTG